MVLTVAVNPLLEKNLFFKNIIGNSNRAYKQELTAGGKGINISRQLNLLGIKNHSIMFLGGPNGKKLRSLLDNEKISYSVVPIKEETREASLIFNKKNNELNTYFGVNPEVTTNEIDQFISKLEKAIINSSVVVFAGSLVNRESSRIYEKGIEFCHKYDKISILDSYGNQLDKQIKIGPTVLHNNVEELKTSLSLILKSEDDFKRLLLYLYNNGVKLSFITNGASDTYAAKADFHYKISNPTIKEINATGSGDAFLAGIIYGIEKSLVFNDFVKLASSMGAINASKSEVCNLECGEIFNLVDDVKITEIGKKIKIIDDSPTI